ncbi:MAG: siderophore-interacting protein [Myxococcota bacterium]
MSIKGSLAEGLMQLGGTASVASAVETLSPKLVRIEVQADAIGSLAWRPGDKIKVHVGDGALRSYTPSAVDVATGTMEMVAVIHGQGLGSAWAENLSVGDSVAFVGPKPSLASVEGAPPWVAFFGDETTLGVAKAILAEVKPGTPILGAIEADDEDLGGCRRCGIPLSFVGRKDVYGRALVDYLESVELPTNDGVVWLSGEAGSLLELRRRLLERGVDRSQLRIKPYWSLKGKAHRKMLEQGELRG